MTIFISSRIVIAFSALAFAGSVAASADQGRRSPELLTPDQVIELSANGAAPADHLMLQKHFLSIAAQNDAEAIRHAAMAEFERKNPNRGSHFPGSASLRAKHCDRLSDSNRVAAEAARTAAAEHERVATAIAQADHVTVQRYFETIAARYDAEAANHVAMNQSERNNANRGSHFPGNSALRAAEHCDRLSTSLLEASQQARDRASEHARMANSN
jgi:hypothetical protein